MKAEPTDRSIEEAVRGELAWEPTVETAHPGISAKDGAVLVTGTSLPTPRGWPPSAADRVRGVSGG